MDPLLAMVHDAMLGIVIADSSVRLPFVGVDFFGIIMNSLLDESMKRPTTSVFDHRQPYLTVPLTGAHNNRLALAASAPNAAPLSANQGFVNLDDAAELLRAFILERSADPMAEIPSGFVTDAQRTLQ